MPATATRLPVCVCVLLAAICLASPFSAKSPGAPLPNYPDTVVATILTGGRPGNAGVTIDGQFVYVPAGTNDFVSVVRTSDDSITSTFHLAGRPDCAVPSPDGSYMFISSSRGSTVSKIRLSDNAIVGQAEVLSDPREMAFVRMGEYLYANIFRAGENHVAVLRTSDCSLVGYITVGHDPWGIVSTADGEHCYVSCGYADSVYVLRTSDNTIETTIPTHHRSRDIALSPAEDLLYVVCQLGECVDVIRTADGQTVASIPVSGNPLSLAISPDGEYLYVTGDGSDTLSIISTSDNDIVKKLYVGSLPWKGAFLPDGSALYVGVADDGCVKVIGNIDAGAVAILSPTGIADSGTVQEPIAVVRNYGPTSQVFPVTLNIGTGYAQTVQETLAPRAIDTVVFPSWTAEPVGRLAVTCFTSLVGDEDPANDTIRDSVRVVGPTTSDVGAISILSPPGIAESGSVVVPSAVVRNFGQTPAMFPVTMDIGSGYSQMVQETLAAGLSDTMAFPAWTAGPVGPLAVTCFTSLSGDEDPANDTIKDSTEVVPAPIHDAGAIAILPPSGILRPGDTLMPRARIRNFGNTAERFFDVRFVIGASYNRTVNVADALPPDSMVELTFPPWVAALGDWAVSCSTMLGDDADRANDKVSSSVHVSAQKLRIEPDQSHDLQAGQSETYQFYALLEGDTGGVVAVARPAAPPGWSLRLCDAAGEEDLPDTDSDGIPDLGYLAPSESGGFSLEVTAPSQLQGDTAPLRQATFLVAGHLSDYPPVADTALLSLTLVPAFSVHNFPNPFSDHTSFVIGLPEAGKANLTVYTRAGERVCRVIDNTDLPAGVHIMPWDGMNDNDRAIAPGTYEYVLDCAHAGKTDRIRKRLVLAKQ